MSNQTMNLTRLSVELKKQHQRKATFNLWVRRANRVMAYFLMLLIVVFMTFPLFWMTLSSFKTEGENLSSPPTIFPHEWTTQHYSTLFQRTSFPIWFRNSAIIAAATTLTTIAISSMGAYVFSRFRYRFFEIFSRAILFAYMVPTVLLLIPVFVIVHSLKISNSLLGLLVVYNAILIPYGLWTLRSYFSGISHEIEEAALIDGCNRWQAFVQVVLPQALPGIISTALFAFTVSWNEYLYASVLLWSSDKQTLSAGVATFMGDLAPSSWGLLMAAGVMITLPLVILFTFLQRFWVAGLGSGAVKG